MTGQQWSWCYLIANMVWHQGLIDIPLTFYIMFSNNYQNNDLVRTEGYWLGYHERLASVDLEVGGSMGPPHHVPGHACVHPAVPLVHTLDGVDVGEAGGGGSLKQFVSEAHIITGIMPHK